MTTDTFAKHCRELARRFLQTAVVVDDQAFFGDDIPNVGDVVAPTRGTSKLVEEKPPAPASGGHRLDTESIIDTFATLGVICGVIGPGDTAMGAISQADIVVLDWQLKIGDPDYTLELLKTILVADQDRNALRLVAFYTGEAELATIQARIVDALSEVGLDPQVLGTGSVEYGHGRVVLYVKPNVNVARDLQERRVAENQLPHRLVEDFSGMTTGLLPGVALVSLTAVRECAHMVLDRFCSRLDPAFLAHRTCLSNPDDAEQQIVNHVAEELRGLMDNAVADRSPAGDNAIAPWIVSRAGDPPGHFEFGSKSLTCEQTIELAKDGLTKSSLSNGDFKYLTKGFAGHDADGLDEELAWIMSSRTVFNAPPPTLWLGTVIARRATDNQNGERGHLICLRPKCDSVRLKDSTSFAFLPLVEPRKRQEQLIVKVANEYRRLGIAFDASGWVVHAFKPSSERGAVVAQMADPSDGFFFTDVDGNRYDWQGELKAEFVQRIARVFADNLSRPAVDESEWLRRTRE